MSWLEDKTQMRTRLRETETKLEYDLQWFIYSALNRTIVFTESLKHLRRGK